MGNGNRTHGEETSDSGYIMKKELTEFAKSLDVGVEKGRWKVIPRIFTLRTWKGGLGID